jgi:hypothetical protein
VTSGIENLINEAACLRLEVAQLRGEVVALRHLVADQSGELAALKIMLSEWPVLMSDDQPVVLH